jgi:hypothetical protein
MAFVVNRLIRYTYETCANLDGSDEDTIPIGSNPWAEGLVDPETLEKDGSLR